MAKRGKLTKQKEQKEHDRPVRWRKYPHLFLIVCEDGKTEPAYFDQFKADIPADTIFLKTVGTGMSSLGVVEQARKEREQLAETARKTVDETWAVFDKDDADLIQANARRFAEAFSLAEKNGIQIAYSNEVFELWLLLHFVEVDPREPIGRREIYARLEGAIRHISQSGEFIYAHGNTAVLSWVAAWGSRVAALKRGRSLLDHFRHTSPLIANPSTSVPLLVQRLMDLIDWYSYSPAR